MSCPVSWTPPTPRHTPSTVRTPRKPNRIPAVRRTVISSVRNTSAATGSAISGVVAFQIPARTEATRCSPYAKRVNGAAAPMTPTTARCPQTRGLRGSRTRVSSRTASTVRAPATRRPSETYIGCNCRIPTLMNRKLDPQMKASARYPGSQERGSCLSGAVTTFTRDTLPGGYDKVARVSPRRGAKCGHAYHGAMFGTASVMDGTAAVQRRLARIALRAGGPYGFALAGGLALAAHGMPDRPREDVDLFAEPRPRAEHPAAVAAVVAAYHAEGFDVVRIDHRTRTFTRLYVTDGTPTDEMPVDALPRDRAHRVELVAKRRREPPVQLEIGPVLHADDVVAGK